MSEPIIIKQFKGIVSDGDGRNVKPEYVRDSEDVMFKNGIAYAQKIVPGEMISQGKRIPLGEASVGYNYLSPNFGKVERVFLEVELSGERTVDRQVENEGWLDWQDVNWERRRPAQFLETAAWIAWKAIEPPNDRVFIPDPSGDAVEDGVVGDWHSTQEYSDWLQLRPTEGQFSTYINPAYTAWLIAKIEPPRYITVQEVITDSMYLYVRTDSSSSLLTLSNDPSVVALADEVKLFAAVGRVLIYCSGKAWELTINDRNEMGVYPISSSLLMSTLASVEYAEVLDVSKGTYPGQIFTQRAFEAWIDSLFEKLDAQGNVTDYLTSIYMYYLTPIIGGFGLVQEWNDYVLRQGKNEFKLRYVPGRGGTTTLSTGTDSTTRPRTDGPSRDNATGVGAIGKDFVYSWMPNVKINSVGNSAGEPFGQEAIEILCTATLYSGEEFIIADSYKVIPTTTTKKNLLLKKVSAGHINIERINLYVRLEKKKTTTEYVPDYNNEFKFATSVYLDDAEKNKSMLSEFGSVDVSGVLLSQRIGYVFDILHPSYILEGYDYYTEIDGIGYCLRNNQVYYSLVGGGSIMKHAFAKDSVIPYITDYKINTVENISNMVGVFTDRELVLLTAQQMEDTIAYSVRDRQAVRIRDRFDVVQTPDGVIIHTKQGIFLSNGSNNVKLSEGITELVEKHFETGNVYYDEPSFSLYYVPVEGIIYRYSTIYREWERYSGGYIFKQGHRVVYLVGQYGHHTISFASDAVGKLSLQPIGGDDPHVWYTMDRIVLETETQSIEHNPLNGRFPMPTINLDLQVRPGAGLKRAYLYLNIVGRKI